MLQLGERLATHGYFVLLPDLFYRGGPAKPGGIGTTGYRMGGRKSPGAAGTYPEEDAAASERHWQTLLALFESKLKCGGRWRAIDGCAI